jgi:succinate dehydrogenase / fumarate reductase, cytochrome b subunit
VSSDDGPCDTIRTTLSVPGPGSDREARASTVRRVRRAFSLCGVVPLGVFLLVHLAINASALWGPRAFVAAVSALQHVPALPLVETLFVFAPLVFHGALGVWLVATGRSLPDPPPYAPAVRVAMRVTAVGTLAFLALHLADARFRSPGTHLGGPELATLLDAGLSSVWRGVPWRGLAYLVGSACATFHLAGGLWGFYATTPAGRDDAARRRRAAWLAIAGGVALWAAFSDVTVLRATGSAPVAFPALDTSAGEPCPSP